MEWFLAVCALLLTALILTLLVKQSGAASLAVLLTLAVSAAVLLRFLPRLREVFGVFRSLGEQAGLSGGYLSVILKIMAISYLAEFAASLCRDAGETAYAAKMELAGKLAVILLAVPVIVNMLESVWQILP